MTHGRKVCNTLKEIRQQIADKNEIEYVTSECHFEEECKGTCPKCDAEVKYLEKELHKRKQLGKTATIAGISLGIAGTFSACNAPQQTNTPIFEQEIIEEMPEISITPPKQEREVYDLVVYTGGIDSNWIEEYPQKNIVPIEEPIEYIEDDLLSFVNTDTNKKDEFLMGDIVETMPEFPGGDVARIKFLVDNIKYPKSTREFPPGTVMISFIVEIDGSLTDFRILRSVHPLLDEEVLRVAKLMPKWKPGEQMGKAVRMRYNMPVMFTLDDE